MGAIAHYLEEAGVASTGISLVRENTQLIRPPRALWVPFELGRPFGAPNAADFQRAVLRAVLSLLTRSDGPVILEDYPHDAPAHSAEDAQQGLVCPVSFPAPAQHNDSQLLAAVLDELAQLAPWHDVFVEHNARSMVGISGLSVTAIARFLDELRTTGQTDAAPRNGRGELLRHAVEDLRNWYVESASARPGGAASSTQLANWFWGETGAGRLILALHPVCLASDDEELRTVAGSMLVPRSQQHRLIRTPRSGDDAT